MDRVVSKKNINSIKKVIDILETNKKYDNSLAYNPRYIKAYDDIDFEALQKR